MIETPSDLWNTNKYWWIQFFQYTPLYVLAGLSHYAFLVATGRPSTRAQVVSGVILGVFTTWAIMLFMEACGIDLRFCAVMSTGVGSAGAIGFMFLQKKILKRFGNED